jgi:hypothetical protein
MVVEITVLFSWSSQKYSCSANWFYYSFLVGMLHTRLLPYFYSHHRPIPTLAVLLYPRFAGYYNKHNSIIIPYIIYIIGLEGLMGVLGHE